MSHRMSRRIAVPVMAAALAIGVSAAPAAAEELPEPGSSGIQAPNGWTPEGSLDVWGQASLGMVTDPGAGSAVAVSLPLALSIGGTAPWIPWCGSFADVDIADSPCRPSE